MAEATAPKIAFRPSRTGRDAETRGAPPGVNQGRNAMKARSVFVGMTCASLLGAAVLASQAQDSIYVPLLTYRTGPYAGSGIPIANGMHDYLAMLNERDGGIGGVKINIEECETGYDTKKGVECWESVKGKKPAVVNPIRPASLCRSSRRRQSTKSRSCRWPMAYRPRQSAKIFLGSSIRPRLIGMGCRWSYGTSAARRVVSTD